MRIIRRCLAKMLLNCFSCSASAASCFLCINNKSSIQNRKNNSHQQDDQELSARISLVKSGREIESSSVRLKDVLYDRNYNMETSLAIQMKPKMVTLRVSMHCHGCAKKVKKHISKMDGVTSYKVDLENKLVVIVGDIFPVEVLQSVSKVIKYTQLWNPSIDDILDSSTFTAYF